MFSRKYSPSAKKDKKKEARIWDHSGTSKDLSTLDFSSQSSADASDPKNDAGKSVSFVDSRVTETAIGYGNIRVGY